MYVSIHTVYTPLPIRRKVSEILPKKVKDETAKTFKLQNVNGEEVLQARFRRLRIKKLTLHVLLLG